MSDFIYLVIGSIGEPGDAIDWEVAAYLDRSEAECHAQRAQARAATVRSAVTNWRGLVVCHSLCVSDPLDPAMKVREHWHTDYYVLPVPLRRQAPNAE